MSRERMVSWDVFMQAEVFMYRDMSMQKYNIYHPARASLGRMAEVLDRALRTGEARVISITPWFLGGLVHYTPKEVK